MVDQSVWFRRGKYPDYPSGRQANANILSWSPSGEAPVEGIAEEIQLAVVQASNSGDMIEST